MMLRFYTPLIEKVLCILLQAQDAGIEVGSAQRYVAKTMSRMGCSSNLTYHLQRSRTLKSDDVTIRQLIDTLGDAILQAQRDGSDVDLIDTIVRVLQLPYSKNVLSGGTLELLRSAILLPKEVATLKTRLDKAEMSCFHCGKDLVTGELTVFTVDSRRGNGIICLRCAGSSIVVPCQGCETKVGLLAKIYKFIKGVECEACKAKGGKSILKAKEADVDDSVMPQPDMPGIANGRPFDPDPVGNTSGRPITFSDFAMTTTDAPPAPTPQTFVQRWGARTEAAGQATAAAGQTRNRLWDEIAAQSILTDWPRPTATPADPAPGGTNETE